MAALGHAASEARSIAPAKSRKAKGRKTAGFGARIERIQAPRRAQGAAGGAGRPAEDEEDKAGAAGKIVELDEDLDEGMVGRTGKLVERIEIGEDPADGTGKPHETEDDAAAGAGNSGETEEGVLSGGNCSKQQIGGCRQVSLFSFSLALRFIARNWEIARASNRFNGLPGARIAALNRSWIGGAWKAAEINGGIEGAMEAPDAGMKRKGNRVK